MESPRHICLREYSRKCDVLLTTSEVALLQQSKAEIEIAPSSTAEGLFDLTPSSVVGVIDLEALTVEIQPKIPIDRFLFLISYSLDPKHWKDHLFDFEERTSILEAIVPGFAHQVRRALGRGILQGYRTEQAALSTVRGRIRFDDQLRSHFGIAPPIEIQYDDFTEDIPENQLIKTALHRLGRLRIRSARVRQMLHEFDISLERVSILNVPYHLLPAVQFTRLNERYRAAIGLSMLILRATSFDLSRGQVRSSTFLIDMNRAFEDFVVTALRESLRLSPQAFSQGADKHSLHLDETRRLRLKPDISWWESGRCVFAGDVKYKRLYSPGYQHADIYQLLAYAVATDLPGGLLIYAKGEREPIGYRVVHLDKELQIVTLDLEHPPDGVLTQISAVAQQIRGMRSAFLEQMMPQAHLARVGQHLGKDVISMPDVHCGRIANQKN